MFGKKNKQKEKKQYNDAQIITIPDVFYGGQDPYIYHEHEEKVDPQTSIKVSTNKKKKSPIIKKNDNNKSHSSTKKIWIFGSLIFVVAIGLISWYYLNQYNQAKAQLLAQNNNSAPPVVIVKTAIPTPVVTTTPSVVVTSTPEIVTTTPSLSNVFLIFPPILTLDTSDIDADSLTDVEEEIFGTDSGTWDTDKDNYYDGQEVYNLYNPKGQAPVKIIDSGVVKEYKNPTLGYRLYYSISWQKGSVDINETQVLFSANTGDYIEVRFFAKEPGQQFISWFSRNAEGQSYTDLSPFVNRFGEKAMVRKDSLVAYFEDDNYIYTIIYHPQDRGPVMYRHVMQMIYQSFRMSKTNTVLPDQVIFPGTENTTSTEVLNNSSTVKIVLPPLSGTITTSTSTTSTNN